MCVNGPAQNVALGTIEISTQVETFWPRGSRCLPVEEVSDLLGPKLERATPSEAGMPVREDWKPLPFRHGEMSRDNHFNESKQEPHSQKTDWDESALLYFWKPQR